MMNPEVDNIRSVDPCEKGSAAADRETGDESRQVVSVLLTQVTRLCFWFPRSPTKFTLQTRGCQPMFSDWWTYICSLYRVRYFSIATRILPKTLVPSKTLTMDLVLIFAICIAAPFASLALYQAGKIIGQQAFRIYVSIIRKRLCYPLLMTRLRGTTNVSILDSMWIIFYCVVNAVCLAFNITNLAQLGSRSWMLFGINMIPLFLGGRTNLIADKMLRMHRARYELAHRWIGRMCFVQGTLHAVATFSLPGSSPSATGPIVSAQGKTQYVISR